MYVLIVIVVLIGFSIWTLNLPVFGSLPEQERLTKIKTLQNYGEGELMNRSLTPTLPEGVSYLDIILGMLKGNKKARPAKALPFQNPDFSAVEGIKITWFGHSSYLLQVDGIKILVDPVFSARTSPFSFIGTKNFEGTGFIKAEDFSELDLILISHDHYDHLDYQSILKLKNKTRHFITSIGVGAHLERWGVPADKITELAWGEEKEISGLKFLARTARHFSGRKFKRNQSLWSAFILQTAQHKLYLGGDSGYDTHFKEDGEQYGPFDLAILECGQYNANWPLIHMFPEQTVQAAIDLKAKVLLPVHWGKFTLATHDWNEPIMRAVKKAEEEGFQLTTPMLGEPLVLDKSYPATKWYLD
ncbi:MBL fold metallo-hydrolase [Pedobacter caeni]|uniref:L-ascorbate metabolism protein UlaG, beta-lactamase superfamily n=1 Tax=Pedobacter caeni TaxID=288992 RepID=A0A1M4WQT4_9SPHI|nr:MBL fold metallo-hydrolase [Pedobacter caeni]SHE83585.1 L-ascorbate metabolism protein UlaG, beta-lactamase superfamily [Pedobacter caeni]